MTDTVSDVIRAILPGVKGRPAPREMVKGNMMLVSHHHADHLDKGLVQHLSRKDSAIIAPPKCLSKLGRCSMPIRAGQVIEREGVKVTAVEAYNPPGSRSMIYHKKGQGVGFVLEIEGCSIYHAGDTGLIDEMSGLGRVDVAFLPIGGRFTMDIAEAVEAVKRISPRIVVPMHQLKADPQEFRRAVEEGTSSQARVLSPGEVMYYP